MMDMLGVREIRRGLIMARKRIDLFKYNVKYRMQRGQLYDLSDDVETRASNHRIMNLLDFKRR